MPRPIASSPLAALGLGLALILSACAAPPAPAPMADRPQAALPVRASDVSVSFAPGAESVAPIDVVNFRPVTEIPRSWAASRLAPQGGTARLTLFVSEASLTAVPLERTGGFSGLITFEDAERFEARIVATLTFQDAEGSASASAEVRLSASVPEHTSNARRQAIYEDLMARTEAAFDAELTRQVRTHFPYRAFAGG